MKVKSGRDCNFNPITLEITLESKEEAGQMYALFNHGSILEAVPSLDGSAIRDAIKSAIGKCPDYQSTHHHLCKILI